MKLKKTPLRFFVLLLPLFALVNSSCSYNISLAGASIPTEMKTFTVNFFENNAQMVNPNYSQSFTEALKNRIRSQSRLSQVDQDGDAIFEGTITTYSIAPTAVGGQNDRAQMTRLSITVQVKYTNKVVPAQSFEQSFTSYQDVNGSDITTQENALAETINTMLTENIFNRAFANW